MHQAPRLPLALFIFRLDQPEESHPHRGVEGAPTWSLRIRSRIEPGAVTDAAVCRYMPVVRA